MGRLFRRWWVGLILCASAEGLAALPVAAETCESPPTLRFALVPAQDSLRELSYYQPILDLLERNTGRKVEIFLPSSYSALIAGLVERRVDVAVLGPESYVLAHDQDPSIQVFGTYWRQGEGIQESGPGYRSVLITQKGSAFTSIAALKGATLALVDPASTSGSMIPAKVFPKEQHLVPLGQYFRQVSFSGGHDQSAHLVATAQVDAAFVATYRLMEAVDAGKVSLSDFNVLWTSPQIPLDPFVQRAELCEDLRKAVAETFLTADQTDLGRKYLDNIHTVKIVPMSNSDYDIIRSVGGKH